MKAKIGFDFTYVIDDLPSGIRKYGEEMLEGISMLNQDYEIVLFVNEKLKNAFHKKFPNYKIITIKFYLENVRYIRRINVSNFAKNRKKEIFKKENCDVIIYPYISNYTAVLDNQKQIIGILDVIPLDEIENKESSRYEKIRKENVKVMSKSKYITTLSEYSKKRLLEINPEFDGEIIVIPSSVKKPENPNMSARDIIETDMPYIFSINSFLKHKNQITLLKAFNMIKDKIPHTLVLVRKTRNWSSKQ